MKNILDYKIKRNEEAVLVTGGAGFVGSNLCRTLLEKGSTVYAVDNFITGRRETITPLLTNNRFQFLKLDIRTSSFKKKFWHRPLAAIYHLACPTGVPNISRMGEEMLTTSSNGTLNVLEIAKKHGAKVLFTSSCEVYGDSLISPQVETYNGNVSTTGPRSAYEEGKRFAEALISLYAKKHGLNAKIVRIFNTYGPGMSIDDTRVIPSFMKSIVKGNEIVIYGDGEQTRTHLYVDDLIRGFGLVMEKGTPGEVYNIGGEKQVPIKDLAKLLLKITYRKNGIVFLPHFIEDHRHREPSLTKIKNLGWQQEISLEEGLKRMMQAMGIKVGIEEAPASMVPTRGFVSN